MQSLRLGDEPERRLRTRFPIALAARYTIHGRLEKTEGTGKTVNISSHGVLMTSAHEVSPGTSISVVIDWPIVIDNSCPLALHILGTVIRCGHGFVSVRFSTRELRTRPKPADRAGRQAVKLRTTSG